MYLERTLSGSNKQKGSYVKLFVCFGLLSLKTTFYSAHCSIFVAFEEARQSARVIQQLFSRSLELCDLIALLTVSVRSVT